MAKGFTLTELLITLTMVIILTAIAIPTGRYFILQNRNTIQVNRLVSAIQFARMQAIKRGQNIVFCSSVDGKHCGGQWQEGQIVITKNDRQVLRVYPALAEGDSVFFQSNTSHDYLQLSPLGFTVGQQGSFYYCPNPHDTRIYARRIVINHTGRVWITDKDTHHHLLTQTCKEFTGHA